MRSKVLCGTVSSITPKGDLSYLEPKARTYSENQNYLQRAGIITLPHPHPALLSWLGGNRVKMNSLNTHTSWDREVPEHDHRQTALESEVHLTFPIGHTEHSCGTTQRGSEGCHPNSTPSSPVLLPVPASGACRIVQYPKSKPRTTGIQIWFQISCPRDWPFQERSNQPAIMFHFSFWLQMTLATARKANI